VFAEHTGTLKQALGRVVAGLGADRDCGCPSAVAGLNLPFELP
jgi:5'-methylthioadenosine phosphorylase